LCCEIRTDDLYVDMMDSVDLYDTSNFDPILPQYNYENRRELGNLRARPDRSLLVSSSACAQKCIASRPQQQISKRPNTSKNIMFESTSCMKISSRSCAKPVETLLQNFARSGRRTTRTILWKSQSYSYVPSMISATYWTTGCTRWHMGKTR